MKNRVFISYSHVDTDFAENLEEKLRDADFEPWLDHKSLQAGDDWRQGIDEAILSSFAMIVILSPEADQSKYVTYEWAFAFAKNIKIIPVLLKKTQMHPRLDTWQYEDFTHRINRPWDKLIRRIQTIRQEQEAAQIELREETSYLDDAVKALRSWKPADRAEAARVLGQLGNPIATDGLLRALSDNEAEVRQSAARALGQLGNVAATVDLIKALHDADVNVAKAATEALIKLNDLASIPYLLDELNESNPQRKVNAITILEKLGDKSVITSLIPMLSELDPSVNMEAVKALVTLQATDALPELFRLLNRSYGNDSPDVENIEMAIRSLANKDAVPYLATQTHSDWWQIRYLVTELLGEIGDISAIPALFERLRDGDVDVQGAAQRSIVSFEVLANLPVLITGLGSDRYIERQLSVNTFAEYGGIQALIYALSLRPNNAFWQITQKLNTFRIASNKEYFSKALKDDVIRVRAAAAEVIGTQRETGYCSELTSLVDDTSPFVRGLTIRALSRIKCIEAIGTIQEKLEDNAPIYGNSTVTVADYAAITLAKLGDKTILPQLIRILISNPGDLRNEAAERIVEIGGKRTMQRLLKTIDTTSPEGKKAIIIVLARLNFDSAIPKLSELWKNNPDLEVRAEALIAMAILGNNTINHDVLLLLNEENPNIRQKAAQTLGRIRETSAIEPLVDLVLNDDDCDVRIAAARALSFIGNETSALKLIPSLSEPCFDRNGDFLSEVIIEVLESVGTPQTLEAVEKWRLENPTSSVDDIPF